MEIPDNTTPQSPTPPDQPSPAPLPPGPTTPAPPAEAPAPVPPAPVTGTPATPVSDLEHTLALSIESALADAYDVQGMRPSRENSLAVTHLEDALHRARRDEKYKATAPA